MGRARTTTNCDVSDKGIRAPVGFLGTRKLVPWAELDRCELVRDDETWPDYFVLRDEAGRRRIDSRDWIGRISPADRDTLLRAVRSRFAAKGPNESENAQALAHAATSSVWDRELDG